MQRTNPVLVAGRSGQLAHSLVVVADAQKLPLLAAGRPQLDITDVNSINTILETQAPSAIVNAAAYTLVDQAETEEAAAFAINCQGAANLARAAARLNIPFIHVSTDYVFDGAKTSPYDENDQTFPLGVYGRSKREGEIAIQQNDPAAVILRSSWVYSPYGQNFVKTMLRLGQTKDRLRVVDDQHGAPTSAKDLAQAIIEIIGQITSSTSSHGGIYHLAARGETTWYGFASAIFASWSNRGHRVPLLEPITTAEYPTAARRPVNSRLNCSKVAREFGIELPDWQQSLEECLGEIVAKK